MGFLDFIFGKKKENDKNTFTPSTQTATAPQSITKHTQAKNVSHLFTQGELKKTINTLSELSYIFRDSETLKQTEGGRNITMMSRLHSYTGMFCTLYEEFNYGTASELLDATMQNHYLLVSRAMNDPANKKRSIQSLSDNWADVLTSIQSIKQKGASDGKKFIDMDAEIEDVTKAVEKWSGHHCPRPQNVLYNPYGITENAGLSAGHSIPDLSDVFARELLPQLLSAKVTGKTEADVTREYVISMIKSYHDNAGYVPMCIVDTLCSQIGNIARRAGVTFPNNSLKDYVLQKIFK